jgi:hypothetical protein
MCVGLLLATCDRYAACGVSLLSVCLSVCVCPCVCLSGIQFHDQWVIHKHVMKKSSEWSLFVSYVFKLFIYKTHANSYINFMQYEMLTIDVSCFMW